jgi:hypothetical protein
VTTPRASKYLATYLNDHLAGATMGTELARRAASENAETPLGALLAELAEEIAEDRESLRELMKMLGVRADRKKVAAGWTAEKAGRLKPNAQLLGYSPLSPLIELEALALGIEGKRLLWRSLQTIADEHGLPADRLDELAARARRQRDRVRRRRIALVPQALTG